MPPKAKAAVAARGRHLSREGVEIKQTQIPLHSPDADDKEPTYDEPQYEFKAPPDQLKLSPEELAADVSHFLRADNPNVSKNITRFNYSDGVYKLESSIPQLAVHFCMEGELIHINSDEAREQAAFLGPSLSGEKKNASTQFEAADLDHEAVLRTGKLLRNQFNFSERATQTFNNPHRNRKLATEPPAVENFSGNVSHWEIYDTYLEDLDRQLVSRSMKPKAGGRAGEGDDKEAAGGAAGAAGSSGAATSGAAGDVITSDRLLRAVKLMERLVNQNAEQDIFWKFKYFEDKDEHSRPDGRGSFTQLWRFAYEKAKKKTVTAIAWNPQFTDLFAVSYGSYDFNKQGSGLIACFSLKNTSHPEYVFSTESGVVSLDWHPQHAALLAAGLYDGTVCVYDVRENASNKPIYVSSDPKFKHTDPVWQVRWAKEEPGKNTNFYSISSDGRVTNWIMNKNELINEEVVEIKLVKKKDESSDEAALGGLAGGCTFDFNKSKDKEDVFVVGTEEGDVHAYSRAIHTQHLRTYQGHHMACYTVRWNPFHPRVFLTCSADWTVKLWEMGTSQPIMTFDLMTPVADIAWAPYSSTVFAVITSDVLRVYDLNVNKHEPIGVEKPNALRSDDPKDAKAKMTHLAFNPKEYIIVVGDDRGVVRTFKLGPNLRKTASPRIEDLDAKEEAAKLERLLIIPDKTPEQEALNTLSLLGPLPPITMKAATSAGVAAGALGALPPPGFPGAAGAGAAGIGKGAAAGEAKLRGKAEAV